jgi:hypothetical protein
MREPELDVFVSAIRRAADILGSSAALAEHLGVTQDEVEEWLKPGARPSLGVFHKCVQVALARTREELTETEERIRESKRLTTKKSPDES